MQAIVETLFDTVYLISVITIGILMVRKEQREPSVYDVWNYGSAFRQWGCIPSGSPCNSALYNWF